MRRGEAETWRWGRRRRGRLERLIERSSSFFQNKWSSLLRRAEFRSRGLEPPSRGKHWKAKGLFGAQEEETSGSLRTRSGRLACITRFVHSKTDLPELLKQHFGEVERFGIIGRKCSALTTTLTLVNTVIWFATYDCRSPHLWQPLPQFNKDIPLEPRGQIPCQRRLLLPPPQRGVLLQS